MRDEEGAAKLKAEVGKRYGVEEGRVRAILAPYRICPLGAHVDHQLGQVTAMAIDRGVRFAYVPLEDGQVHLASADFPGEVNFDLASVPDRQEGDWGNYARGAVKALQKRFALRQGIAGVTAGRLGEGGLSSSAAVGVAYLMALEEANGLEVTAEENIALDQAIENGYLGLRNGILDQAAILLSKAGHLTHLDCRSGEHALIPQAAVMAPFSILIPFSGLKQALVGTDYNRRVEECAAAAEKLLEAVGRPGEESLLGNITAAEYALHRNVLKGAPARRAAHYFSEVDRVVQGTQAWREGDLEQFGRLMTASGESSIHSYECGCEPLIDLYRILVETEGVYGGRFSGAGFRGCCVGLVVPEAAAAAAERIRRSYAEVQPDLAADAPVLICAPADGARFL